MNNYSKPPLTIKEQINLLKSRGLIIDDQDKVNHILSNISYYRLSGYFYPLLENKQTHIFKKNSNFESAFNLYCFDRELRLLIFNEIEKIEISFRNQIIYNLSLKYGSLWFSDDKYFKDYQKHKMVIDKLLKEFNNSDETFIQSFKNKYSDMLPPSWISMEIITFGHLSKLYKLLNTIKEKRDIANFFGLSDTVFISWIHSLVYVRNICAHHSRLWNRKLSISPKKPRTTNYTWINQDVREDKIYFVLCIIQYLIRIVNPKSTFKNKLQYLLKKYPNIDKKSMGFSSNWEEELFWK